MPHPVHPLSEDRSPPRSPRILHIADEAAEAERLGALLLGTGLVCEIVSAAAPDFTPTPHLEIDLVVCEFSLSSTEALVRLAALRDVLSAPPWLFVSTAGGTPAAVESRARFPFAVRAALQGLSRVAPESSRPSAPAPRAGHWRSLRRFAEGVAHDFNNLLTVINGHSSVVLMRSDLPAEALDSLQQIYAAGERASGLTRRLLAFGRASAIAPKPRALNDAIRDFTPTLARMLGSKLALEIDLDPDLPCVAADGDLLEHVLQNLVLHLRSGSPREGALFVRTRLRARAATAPGRFACLSVGRRPGPAIGDESSPDLFEPYLAQKKAGDDTGLCLATAFGTVENHHGWIEVETAPDAGQTFHVYLPVSAETAAVPPASAVPAASAASSQPPAPGGGETILLVEDEAPVREFARAALQQHGYRVLVSASGKDALETWQWHSPRISLLLTDLVLPDDFSGIDLALRLQAEKPSLKVLCTSGHARDVMDRQAPAPRNMCFLQKPYQIRFLAQAVRQCLDAC